MIYYEYGTGLNPNYTLKSEGLYYGRINTNLKIHKVIFFVESDVKKKKKKYWLNILL